MRSAPPRRTAFVSSRPLQADTVRVDPDLYNGTTEMVPLQAFVLRRAGCSALSLSFDFRKIHVVLDARRNCFVPLPFADHAPLDQYREWSGWASAEDVALAESMWGPNEVRIPIPRFLALLQEQMLAPFFVFQVTDSRPLAPRPHSTSPMCDEDACLEMHVPAQLWAFCVRLCRAL